MGGIDELTVEECLSLLETKRIGRIGPHDDVGTGIFPVNYVLSGDQRIVFRTLPYGVIGNHAHEADVAFEVDDLDDESYSGWSVLAVGRCSRIEDPSEVRLVRRAGGPDAVGRGPADPLLHDQLDRPHRSSGRQRRPLRPGQPGAEAELLTSLVAGQRLAALGRRGRRSAPGSPATPSGLVDRARAGTSASSGTQRRT